MGRKPISKRVMTVLVGTAAVLTISLAVALVTGHVLGKMGDSLGQNVLGAVALGVGIIWAVDVVCLVLALGVNASAETEDPPDEPY